MPPDTRDEVVDPHVHLFDLRGTPRPMQPLGRLFGWNERLLRAAATRLMPRETVAFFGERTPLLGDYLPADFRSDAGPAAVGPYVHIQAGWTDRRPLDPVGETRWLAGLDDGPAAIVGHADLTLGDEVMPVLAAHRAVSPKFRGIRHMLSWHPAGGIMDYAADGALSASARFRAGLARLAEHDLSFDAWCYHHQLADVADLAAAVPDVPTVLCHMGTPVGVGGEFGGVGVSAQERARIADEWRDGILAVAAVPHVRVKLSGLFMPVLGFGFHEQRRRPGVDELVDRLSPFVTHCIDAFGAERCMFASNFPVDAVSVDYATLADAMRLVVAPYGPDAERWIFADTAREFYRL